MSAPSARPLFHVLYTNAAGGEGGLGGFRAIAINFPGDEAERRPIEEWLKGLEPSGDSAHGVASSRFRVQGAPCAALALVLPGFLADDHGRAGRLTHALLLPLEKGEQVGHFGRALHETARRWLESFNADSQPSLAKYEEGCRVALPVEVGTLHPDELVQLPESFLATFFAAAGGTLGEEVDLPEVQDEEELAERLVTAGGALPPALRLQVRWGVGVERFGGGFVARPGGAAMAREARDGIGGAIAAGLCARLRSDPGAVTRIAEDWSIDRWERLRAAYEQPERESEPSPPTPAPRARGEARAKRGAAAPGAETTSHVTPRPVRSAKEYDEESRSLYEDLKEYVDRRLAGLAEPPAAGPGSAWPPGPALVDPDRAREQPLPRALRLLVLLRPELYLLVVVSLFVLFGLGLATRRPESASAERSPSWSPRRQQAAPPAAEAEPRVTALPDDPQRVAPTVQWASFVRDDPARAAAWFRALAAHRGLESGQVSRNQARIFAERVRDLEEGAPLDAEQVRQSATGLFEYAYALWARDTGRADAAQQVVSGDPTEADDHLEAFLQSIGLDGRVGARPRSTDPDVQAAVAMAWIDDHSFPPAR